MELFLSYSRNSVETLNNATIIGYSILNNFVFGQSREHLTTLNIEFKSSCLVSEPTTPASDKPCGLTWLYPRKR